LPLIGKVNRDLALDLDLFSRGGLEILRAIERCDYDVLSARPAISKAHQTRTGAARAQRQGASISPPWNGKLREGGLTQESTSDGIALYRAYAECRSIARREAKNFYYAFIALPTQRRNAICAIYAFMRKADDLADDESFSIVDRRAHLDKWLTQWRAVCDGGQTEDPVFLAVHDAIARFALPLSLLDELVAGVTMDLDRADTGSADTYATFEDLYRYCYLVASVVGLVCIRIFGYKDARARNLRRRPASPFS